MNTVEFKRNGQNPRYIYAGVNYRGYLARKIDENKQSVYISYFDAEKISDEEKRIIEEKKYRSVDDVINGGLAHTLIRFETNDRYSVRDIEEVRRLEREARMKELIEKIKKEGFIFEHTLTAEDFDEEGITPCYHYTLTHIETKRQFKFIDRNIFDFGRVVNPVRGGIYINVEKFMSDNKYTFSTEEKRDEYRKSHPTSSGWILDRYNEGIEEVEELEVKAYQIVVKNGFASRDIRL